VYTSQKKQVQAIYLLSQKLCLIVLSEMKVIREAYLQNEVTDFSVGKSNSDINVRWNSNYKVSWCWRSEA